MSRPKSTDMSPPKLSSLVYSQSGHVRGSLNGLVSVRSQRKWTSFLNRWNVISVKVRGRQKICNFFFVSNLFQYCILRKWLHQSSPCTCDISDQIKLNNVPNTNYFGLGNVVFLILFVRFTQILTANGNRNENFHSSVLLPVRKTFTGKILWCAWYISEIIFTVVIRVQVFRETSFSWRIIFDMFIDQSIIF